MNSQEYLTGINKTWKKDDKLKELLHCRFALMEEVGEIAGWYKKHICYGREKEGAIKTGLKEEFGDLLYYIYKTCEITGLTHFLKEIEEGALEFEQDVKSLKISELGLINVIAEMSNDATGATQLSIHTNEFAESLQSLFNSLTSLIIYEGWDLEEIKYSNLAKLDARHGNSFKQTQALPEDRDKDKENNALNG